MFSLSFAHGVIIFVDFIPPYELSNSEQLLQFLMATKIARDKITKKQMLQVYD
jgi:hypothetical protein